MMKMVTLFILLALGVGCKRRAPHRRSGGAAPPESVHTESPVNAPPVTPREKLFATPGPFTPLPKPSPGEWLAEHPEQGQTFEEYKGGRFNMVNTWRHTLVVLPLGSFKKGQSPPLTALKEFMEAFFMMKVRVLTPIPAPTRIKRRNNPHDGQLQLHAGEVLSFLATKLPDDAYALIAITMTDLYPQASWNFVFGMASLRARVGVFSFARYAPSFTNEQPTPASRTRMLLRSMKVLSHEMAHMFGMHHCVYYFCNVNGSNSMEESDRAPLHLCPVCLRKLWYNVRFDPVLRYKKLRTVYQKYGLSAQAAWVARRLRSALGTAQSSTETGRSPQ